MNDAPRSRVLRRARYATAGLVVSAVAGTAVLTAVASDITAQGQSGGTGGSSGTTGTGGSGTGGSGIGGSHDGFGDDGSSTHSGTVQGGTGLVPAPQSSQPQSGTNAS